MKLRKLTALSAALALALALPAGAEGLDALEGMLDGLASQATPTPAPEDPLEGLEGMLDGLVGDEAEPWELRVTPPPRTDAEAAPGPDSYALLEGFLPATLNDTVLVQVPLGWGNNAGDRALTSYSPVNGSGAISPNAGTLSTNWFSVAYTDAEAVLREYAAQIAGKKIVSNLQAAPATVAGQPGSLLQYQMDVGANHFDVHVLCFAYQGSIYALDLTQGARSETDYTPVFDAASGTFAIYDETWDIDELIRRAEAAAPAQATRPPQTAAPSTPQSTPQPAPPSPGGALPEDLGQFAFTVNGNTYPFPVRVADMAADDLPIDQGEWLPYDLSPDAASNGGFENPLVNTQFYAYDDPASMELIGITNLTGRPAPLSEGVVTALVDTTSQQIRLTLPGGVSVGSPESAVATAFPEFSGRALDGLAGFRGNELLYACNVRSDGSHGYALIRNDAPFYSALTLVCAGGVVTEINFECLGAALADGIFL